MCFRAAGADGPEVALRATNSMNTGRETFLSASPGSCMYCGHTRMCAVSAPQERSVSTSRTALSCCTGESATPFPCILNRPERGRYIGEKNGVGNVNLIEIGVLVGIVGYHQHEGCELRL